MHECKYYFSYSFRTSLSAGRYLSFIFYSGFFFTFMLLVSCFLFIVYLPSYFVWSLQSSFCISLSFSPFFSSVLFPLLIVRWIPIVDRSICKCKGAKERQSERKRVDAGKRKGRRRKRCEASSRIDRQLPYL